MRLPKCRRIPAEADPGPLLAKGWREIEELVTYEREPDNVVPSEEVSLMDCWDSRTVIGIASVSFTEDRLHRDPKVDDDLADRFKIDCVKKAVRRRQPILIYGYPIPVAFLIIRPSDPVSIVDLLAVLPDHRGNGIAAMLVSAFLYASREYALCRAGTQAHNTAACRMYESLGFHEVKRERTFHRP